jgi:hypothetical protein
MAEESKTAIDRLLSSADRKSLAYRSNSGSEALAFEEL